MLKEVFEKRFRELDEDFNSIVWKSHHNSTVRYSPNGGWRSWATSAQNLILAAFGLSSPHYKNYLAQYDSCGGRESDVRSLYAIFSSARNDFAGGYVFNVELRVSGEVFGDMIVLARQALSEGHTGVAAVLACAALEDALKRYAISSGLNVEGKTMQEVVNALKGGGQVSGVQKTLLDAMPRIRNAAMHADWGKLSEPDVSSVLGFTEQFLLSKFSP